LPSRYSYEEANTESCFLAFVRWLGISPLTSTEGREAGREGKERLIKEDIE